VPGASIEIPAASVTELRYLVTWLGREDALRGRVRLAGAPGQPGDMGGGVIDAVAVAVSSGGAATVLVRSLFAWLGQRQQGLRASMTIQDQCGRQVRLEVSGLQDADAVIGQVLGLFAGDEQ
jgi:Effector Associated Constant Component 1